jgi:hypothetical protein
MPIESSLDGVWAGRKEYPWQKVRSVMGSREPPEFDSRSRSQSYCSLAKANRGVSEALQHACAQTPLHMARLTAATTELQSARDALDALLAGKAARLRIGEGLPQMRLSCLHADAHECVPNGAVLAYYP